METTLATRAPSRSACAERKDPKVAADKPIAVEKKDPKVAAQELYNKNISLCDSIRTSIREIESGCTPISSESYRGVITAISDLIDASHVLIASEAEVTRGTPTAIWHAHLSRVVVMTHRWLQAEDQTKGASPFKEMSDAHRMYTMACAEMQQYYQLPFT
jgi:hypothetical protein